MRFILVVECHNIGKDDGMKEKINNLESITSDTIAIK